MSQQAPTKLKATIIAAHGRHYLAEAGGVKLQCVTRGKKTNVAVGDVVNLKMTSEDQAVIESIAAPPGNALTCAVGKKGLVRRTVPDAAAGR